MLNTMMEKIRTYIKNLEQKRLLIIVLAMMGITMILFGDFFKKKNPPELASLHDQEEAVEHKVSMTDDFVTTLSDMEQYYEESLQAMLNKINGVTEVEVMVNIESSNVQIYEKDMVLGSQTTVETDQGGGKRTVEDETKETKLVYVRKGDEELPVLLTTEKPKVRGVFIIAKGVDNARVKMMVVEAVSRVLDIPSYRISVLAK